MADGANTRDNTAAWRRSAVEAAACLYRYDQLWNKGISDPGDPSRRGNAFHTAAELYIRELWAQQTEADIDIARDSFSTAIVHELLPAHLIPETEELFFRWAERFELKIDAYEHVEKTLYTTRHGRTYSWKPDLVYSTPKGIVIYDWKTHYAAWTPLQARHEFQSRFYLLLASDEWPNQPSYTMVFVFVRLGLQVEVTFDQGDLGAIERQVDAMIAVIEEADRRKEYPATPGPHCAFCRLECPRQNEQVMVPVRIDDAATFDRLAAAYLVAERRRKQLAEVLGGYVTAEGPTVSHGMTFAQTEKRSEVYSVDRVLAAAEEYGLDLDLHVGKSQLWPYLDRGRYPEAAQALGESQVDQKTTFEFTVRRASLAGGEVR